MHEPALRMPDDVDPVRAGGGENFLDVVTELLRGHAHVPGLIERSGVWFTVVQAEDAIAVRFQLW